MSSRLEADAAFEGTNLGFLYRQFTRPKPLPDVRLTSQVAIVTGSNVGLGLEASRQLLGLGLSHLVMGVRSQAKGDAAAGQLRQLFPNSLISVWILDMESYESIQKFVEQCATLPRIDIVTLNAGLAKPSYTTVPATGHELTIQVNYLSTALLSILLLPVLKSKKIADAPKPPVLGIVGSDLAWRGGVAKGPVLQQFDGPETFNHWRSYVNSKFLLAFFVATLAESVNPRDVLVNMPNPGTTKGTAIGRETSALHRRIMGFLQFFLGRSLESGASTYLDAALAHGIESHGSFVSEWAIKP